MIYQDCKLLQVITTIQFQVHIMKTWTLIIMVHGKVVSLVVRIFCIQVLFIAKFQTFFKKFLNNDVHHYSAGDVGKSQSNKSCIVTSSQPQKSSTVSSLGDKFEFVSSCDQINSKTDYEVLKGIISFELGYQFSNFLLKLNLKTPFLLLVQLIWFSIWIVTF